MLSALRRMDSLEHGFLEAADYNNQFALLKGRSKKYDEFKALLNQTSAKEIARSRASSSDKVVPAKEHVSERSVKLTSSHEKAGIGSMRKQPESLVGGMQASKSQTRIGKRPRSARLSNPRERQSRTAWTVGTGSYPSASGLSSRAKRRKLGKMSREAKTSGDKKWRLFQAAHVPSTSESRSAGCFLRRRRWRNHAANPWATPLPL